MHSAPGDIAIIGIGTLLPKANQPSEFWENLVRKVDAVSVIPAHRWDWRLYFDENRQAEDKIYSKWGGFLDDLEFDPTRFGMPPKSVASVDPMQLMALETARRAMADAGYEQREFDRENTSVILGASGGAGDVGMQYGLRAELPRFQGELPPEVAARIPAWTEDTFAGILINVVAGRIANRLDLGGVNFTVDAACASSLAAVHLAIGELLSGRSNMAITGGVDTVQGPFGYMCFSKTQALSPRGRSRPFDQSADGIAISEGLAMVVLKRRADAERDGDRIYAVIKAVAGSSDGKAKGLSAPLQAGQLRAMRRAYAQAGFGPETIDLFEAHGTGTVVGDTTELQSTTELVRSAGGRARQAAIGSVKSLIGHTKASAGVVGLIKTALALHHRILPPHFGVENPVEALKASDSPLYLIDEARPWLAAPDRPRRAAVSAFGFGGANFHAVLEEHTGGRAGQSPVSPRPWPAELLLWSAKDRAALREVLVNGQRELEQAPGSSLRALARRLAMAWRAGGETLALVATDREDLQAKLSAAVAWLGSATGKLPTGVYHGARPVSAAKLAVLFPGQGSQYPEMLRELTLHFPVLRETLEQADGILGASFGSRFGQGTLLSHFIYPRGVPVESEREAAARALTSTDVAQPALGAVEAGLWRLLHGWKLLPDMLAGHSYGEFVALFAAGKLDFPTLMLLSEGRGRSIVDAASDAGSELGTMAAVQASREIVESAIAGIDGVVVANHNAPLQCIISGSASGIKAAVEKLSGIATVTPIPVAAAFHSPLVAKARRALATLIDQATWHDGGLPVYSNTTGERHPAESSRLRSAMCEHLVRPVEFVAEVEAMYRDGARIFLELGPKPVLSRSVDRILADRPHWAIPLDVQGDGVAGLLRALAQLLCAGVELDVASIFSGHGHAAADGAGSPSTDSDKILSRHAWMLHGSGARMASEPVRQIGVRREDQRDRPANSNGAHHVENASKVGPSTGSPSSRENDSHGSTAMTDPSQLHVSRLHSNEVPQMIPSRRTSAAVDVEIMSGYFESMRKFLETQERVMGMLLQGGHIRQAPPTLPGEPPWKVEPPAPPVTRAPAAAPARPAAPVAAVAPTVPVAPEARVATPAAAHVPAPAPNGPSRAATTPAPAVNGSLSRERLQQILLAIVEEKTGYPPDMIGMDQKLEADLGIDSIKNVEIVGALLKSLPASIGEALGGDRGRLIKPTLSGMLDVLQSLATAGNASASSAPAVAPKAAPKDAPQAAVPGNPVAAKPTTPTPAPAAQRSDRAPGLDRAEMERIVLAVVEDKTGYPPDMVGMNQDLEADLGIDSIKKVEIIGALLKALPPAYGEALGDQRGRMTRPTLGEMLDVLQKLQLGGQTLPFDRAETGNAAKVPARPFRFSLEAGTEVIDARAARSLEAGCVLLTADRLGVADELSALLKRRGCRVIVIEPELLDDVERLRQRCAELCAREDALVGVIHLAPLDADWLPADSSPEAWSRQLRRNEESLAVILSSCAAHLRHGGRVLSASALGGHFGRDGRKFPGLSIQGGAVGLLKSFREERPDLGVKAVDVDLDQAPGAIAACLLDEFELQGGRQEVGYPGGQRTVFRTVAASRSDAGRSVRELGNLVVLATGGLRGITAELLRELALPGNTLIVTGRSAFPAAEPDETKALQSVSDLRQHFIAEVRQGRLQLNPAQMQSRIQEVLAAREMRANLDDLRARGAVVEYHAVDVTDAAAMARLFAEIVGQHGPVSGVVHGAGVLDDKLLAQVTSASWLRVVETKVLGLLNLQSHVAPPSLKFFTVFSSVAGRYGNSGQTSYAAANELMNRLCKQLHGWWGGRVQVSALCWGPWGATTFGAGMVTPETEAKFAKRGVTLVTPELGRRFFADLLAGGLDGPVEFVCGEGPWEATEAAVGRIELTQADEFVPTGALLDGAQLETLQDGSRVVSFKLDPRQPYLQDHRLEGTPVLPAAAALEIMAEAAQRAWPGWRAVEVRDCRAFKGIELKDESPLWTAVVSSPQDEPSDAHLAVQVALRSKAGAGPERIHYRASLQLARQVPEGIVRPVTSHGESRVTPEQAYSQWLIHGPSLRMIEEIEGISPRGALARVRSSRPADWMAVQRSPQEGWCFDPALIDAAAQMAWIWSRAMRDETALPAGFARVVRHADVLPEILNMDFELIDADDPHLVVANVYFSDSESRVLLVIEGLQSVSSAALNRLGAKATAATTGQVPEDKLPAEHRAPRPTVSVGSSAGQEPIAIIGMACMFPQAPGLRAFWRNILGCVDAISEPQPDWEAQRYLDSGRITTASGGYLRDLYRFDPRPFGIMPNSLDGGEPDQFLALQVAREALLDAGYDDPDHDHRDTGIVLGHSTYLHRGQGNLVQHQIVLDQTLELLRSLLPDLEGERMAQARSYLEKKLPQFNVDVAPGLVPNVMTGRIANRLNLRGPNYLVDAACSSSLLAVAAAMDELRSGRSRMMIAGGVNGSLPAEVSVIFSLLGALTRRGKVRPFGRGSDGTLLGEGLGAVVLKPLGAALSDGDRVYAVLRAVGQASDGRGLGLLAPSKEGEALAIQRAYAASGIDPSSIELIEAHGTGIPLGDKTEISALKSILGARQGTQGSVAVGSVKSMISHCIPAAGIAGLIKTALALHHSILPPTLCGEVNPELELETTPLYVNTAPRPWIARPGSPQRAGVNSFGFGGINAHAILEQAPQAARVPALLSAWPQELCVFSGSSEAELEQRLARTIGLLERRSDVALSDLAATLALRDGAGSYRLALVARDGADLLEKLRSATQRLRKNEVRWSTRTGACYSREPLGGQVAFMFPGEGSQYLNMFADLALHFPEIRRWLAFWRGLYPEQAGHSRTDILFPPASELSAARRAELEARLLDMDVGSEAAFVGAQGMYALLRSLGVRPDVMVGHSTGESSALAAACAMPVDDMERMAEWVRRLNRIYGQLLEDGKIPTGALLTVGALSRAETDAHVQALAGSVVIAMDNCPNERVFFGDQQSVAALHQSLSAAGGICKLLPFDRGYHTPHFQAVQAAFLDFYAEIGLGAPKVPVYSCASTGLFPTESATARALAAAQWATTVRFRETVEQMHADGVRIFIEVGPSASLSAFVNDTLVGREYLSLATDRRQRGGIEQLLTVLANLYVNGRDFEIGRLFAGRSWQEVDLDGAAAPARGVPLHNTMPVLHIDQGEAAELRDILDLPGVAKRSEALGLALPAQAVQEPHPPLGTTAAPDIVAPLLHRVIELDGRHCRAECELSLARDRFLRHHVISGRVSALNPDLLGLSCVPLMVSLEIMAEACALVAGSSGVRTIENVRTFDWVALDEGELTLEVCAELTDPQRRTYTARIERNGQVVVAAEFGFLADWRLSALPSLDQLLPSRWDAAELYATGMFHGPVFQSVAYIEGWSHGGIDAELTGVPLQGFFVDGERPELVLNPVLLDSLGQLSAFWICEQVGTNFNSFPSTIERIELYAECPQDLPELRVRARQQALGGIDAAAHDARAWQFEVVGADGAALVRVANLVNVYFPVPEEYYLLRHDPLHGQLGRPLQGLDGGSVLLWELAHLPEDFCLRSNGIFLRILAHTVLSAEERAEWQVLQGSARQRRQWLLSRLCLKEAVRHWVQRQTGQMLYLADIVVAHDDMGAPLITGWWTAELMPAPAVSLSHNRRMSVAAVTWPNRTVGIDFEALGDVVHSDLVAGALAPAEREELQRFPQSEWPERVVRIWCAKESAAKALGTGLLGRPDHFLVSFPHQDWRSAQVRFSDSVVDVSLARERDLVVALAACSPN